MKQTRTILIIFLLIVLSLPLQAQNDSLITPITKSTSTFTKEKKHSPITAVCLSIIPGGGQIYNHKAWKIPIIYAGLCGCTHFIFQYGSEMVSARKEYIDRKELMLPYANPDYKDIPTENLITLKNNAMRKMEIAFAAAALVYALNMVDAMVDAHLYEFDVSDNLTLQWSPSLIQPIASFRPSYGVNFQIRF